MYSAQRASMTKQLGGAGVNERWLWHGTPVETLPQILANGFLRDFNRRGVYGKGTYFASSSQYSLNDMYAVPDAHGMRHLLLVRVLVGEACKGDKSMEQPTEKPGTRQLHESMVDRLDKPSIFVLSAGSDHRSYAEFVVRVRTVD